MALLLFSFFLQYPVIVAFGILKKAAAKVNVEFGLDKKIGTFYVPQKLPGLILLY